MPQTATVDSIVQAWEFYCTGSYSQIVESYSEEGDLSDLMELARLEIQDGYVPAQGAGLFADLLAGMHAFHAGDFKRATELLGAWLQKKSYFAVLVLERFLVAAENSKNYRVLFVIGKRFLDRDRYHAVLIGPLVRSAFFMEQYKDCGVLFDRYRKHFRDPLLLHRTALALMYIKRHQEAEQILLAVYKKMTGKKYALNYEKVAAGYGPVIEQIPALEKKKRRSDEEEWELGMAYLFNQQFDQALNIFRSLQQTAA